MLLGIQAPSVLWLHYPLGAALIIMIQGSLWPHQHSCQQERGENKMGGGKSTHFVQGSNPEIKYKLSV